MILDADAARDGFLVAYAMDMSRAGLFPALDPRAAGAWVLRGHILGTDRVWMANKDTCYGYLAESRTSPGTFVAVLRGTDGVMEWFEDALFSLLPYAHGGHVESGFWGIYAGMRYTAVGEQLFEPLAAGIARAVGAGTVRVLGHSLGSSLSTYLTLDLALVLGERVSAGLLASPRAGDGFFGEFFHRVVKDYKLYNYKYDIVPGVPRGFDFIELPGAIELTPDNVQARIKLDFDCNHHCLSYIAMLGGMADFKTMGFDPGFISCLLGPPHPPAAIVS